MRKSLLGIMFVLTFILFGFQECAPPGMPLPEPTSPSGVERASMNGKYSELLEVLDVPEDQTTYGDFYDMGYKTTKSHRGYSNLPTGYWVYVSPSWYIWKNRKGAEEPSDTDESRPDPDYDAGSLDGAYEKILKTLYVPEDRSRYGTEYDWGYRTVTSYRDYSGIPKGYWVYAYPYWYIWKDEAELYTAADERTASVNGKYSDLLNVIRVEEDKDTYGTFHDYGYSSSTTYKEYTLKPGYRVYVYPNWFNWGELTVTWTQEDQRKASVNGKYSDLLDVIRVDEDKDTYGAFHDYGYSSSTTYKEYTLEPGYRVYVYPNWFNWGSQK